MHLKNSTLIRDKNDYIKLNPANDLLSTKLIFPEDKEESTLTIYGKKANLWKKDFDAFDASLGLNSKVVLNIYKKFSTTIDTWRSIMVKSFLSEEMKENFTELLKLKTDQLQV